MYGLLFGKTMQVCQKLYQKLKFSNNWEKIPQIFTNGSEKWIANLF